MIYVLEKKTWHFDSSWSNHKDPFQYIDLEYFIKEFLFKDQPLTHHLLEQDEKVPVATIDKILSENSDIKVFACNLECFQNTKQLLMYDEFISKKYPNVFFIFFYHELDVILDNNIPTNGQANVIYIVNSFAINNPHHVSRVFPYYLVNSYLQKNYGIMMSLYTPNANLRKFKKYNFLNGVHKPHRFMAYDLIKKNDLLDDGFFSYLDYPHHLQDYDYKKQTSDWLGIGLEEFEDYLTNFKIPYLLETYEPVDQPGIFPTPFINPQIYSWQSYVSITSETYSIINSDIVSLSEKSFKAFAGFNIPLIYGQTHLYDYLRDFGFDMFDDFFDNSKVLTKEEMITQLDNNLKKLKNISMKELHEFYVKSSDRIFHNFETLTNRMKDRHYEEIHKHVNKLSKQ